MLPGMLARVFKLLSAAILVSSFTSCMGYGAEYRELEITGYSGAQVWRGVTDFATSRGFRVDTNETDVGRRVYQTRWSGEAVAFRGSSRRRFRAEIHELEKAPPKWLVQYYVEEQAVSDTSKNMNPADEDWEFVRQHRVVETQFLRVMQITFPPLAGQRGAKATAGADANIRG